MAYLPDRFWCFFSLPDEGQDVSSQVLIPTAAEQAFVFSAQAG